MQADRVEPWIEAYVDAAAAALALPIAPEHRRGVLHYFALAAAMAERVDGLALSREAELSGIFMPVSAPAPTLTSTLNGKTA